MVNAAADVVAITCRLGNILFFSNHVRDDQRLYVRVHLQELRVPYLVNVNWERVNGLFFVAEWVRDDFSNNVWDDSLRKKMVERSHYVPNVVDPAKFIPNKSFPVDGRNLSFGMLGAIMKRKGHLKAVQLYHRILTKYPDKTGEFYIQGHRPRELKWMSQEDKDYEKALLTYIEKNKIAEKIHFLPHGDPLSFFNSIDIAVSMSDFESFHYSIPDGMLMGCLPMIRNWRGAEKFYPSEYIFETDDPALKAQGRGVVSAEFTKGAFKLKDILDGLNIAHTVVNGVVKYSVVLPFGCYADWSRDIKGLGEVRISGLRTLAAGATVEKAI